MARVPFSVRQGYQSESHHLITEDAPEQIRVGLREVLTACGHTPAGQRHVICAALRIQPDPDNWSEYPNIDDEVDRVIHGLKPWYKFYNLCEKLSTLIKDEIYNEETKLSSNLFEFELNKLFGEEHIGYRIKDGQIEKVGTPEYHDAVDQARRSLRQDAVSPARQMLEKGLAFRSSLPPDYANAVKEAVNAVEGISQIVTNSPGTALPQMLTAREPRLPSGIEKIYKGLYGYGSGSFGARHAGVGGHNASAAEAELVIHVAAACITYAIETWGASPGTI